LIPFLLFCIYGLYNEILFYLHPEKIDGYWQATINEDHIMSKVYQFHTMIAFNMMTAVLLLIPIIRDKKNILRLSLLFIFRILAPIFYFTTLTTVSEGKWTIPGIALIGVVDSFITTWFVSDYRLFNSSIKAANSDLLNSISDLAISTDKNLLMTNANDQVNSLLNVQQGNSIIAIMAKNSALTFQQLNKSIQQLIRGEKENFEITMIDKKEKEHLFDIKVSRLKRNDQIQGYTFLMTDLSEIHKKEKELQLLHETKDRLFAIIGRDLRKPALAFRGISKKVNFLIKKQEFERLSKFGMHIEQLSLSMNNLLDNLLSWALQQRNSLPYHPEKINIKAIISDIYGLFQPIADDKEIELVMNIDESSTIFYDSKSFYTIFRNLVDNALKYTPIGGVITINSTEQVNGLMLKVVDTGIGMNPDMIDTIFHSNKNNSRAGIDGEQGTGLGLGLILIRDLITLQKGTIHVESHWNEGTTFEIFLPT